MNFLICNAIFFVERVQFGSLQHILPISIVCLFGIGFILFSRKKRSLIFREKTLFYLTLFLSLTVFVFHIWQLFIRQYDITKDLPLYLCSLMALVIPIFGYYRKYWMYEILFFWIIVGTLQGVITPDIPVGFPSFDYFRYWIVHLGLIFIALYATFVLHMKPKFKSVFKSYFALQIYVLIIIGINYILKANYGYLNQKPESASILDYFGEWPFYVIVVQLLLIPVFLIVYLPFYLRGLCKKNK